MEIPRTHTVSILLELLEQTGENVDEYWDWVDYQAFAVQFRYETIGDQEVPIDRQEAIERLSALMLHVRTIVGGK